MSGPLLGSVSSIRDVLDRVGSPQLSFVHYLASCDGLTHNNMTVRDYRRYVTKAAVMYAESSEWPHVASNAREHDLELAETLKAIARRIV